MATSDKYAFVFDIDYTLTTKHTGGNYEASRMNIVDFMGGPQRFEGIQQLFDSLTTQGHLIFINTRGNRKNSLNLLKDAGLLEYVHGGEEGVYSACIRKSEVCFTQKEYDECISGTDPCVEKDNAKYPIGDSENWPQYKLNYLNDIAERYNLDKNKIYFYDDTYANISIIFKMNYKDRFQARYVEKPLELISMVKENLATIDFFQNRAEMPSSVPILLFVKDLQTFKKKDIYTMAKYNRLEPSDRKMSFNDLVWSLAIINSQL